MSVIERARVSIRDTRPMEPRKGGHRATTSLSLTFDVPGRELRCPMVTATIAGCTTQLIVDTGATSHLLTTDLVRRAGLHLTAAAPGRDVAGDPVPSWTVGDVLVEVEDSSVMIRDVVAIDGPEPFREWGVGGFLSPQTVSDDATVLLDLVLNRIDILGDESATVLADLVRRFDDYVLLEGARHAAGTIGIRTRVPPAPPVVAIFDTGAAETQIARAALDTEVNGTMSAGGKGVGGSGFEVTILKNQHLEVGATAIRVPELAVRDEIPAPDDAADGELPLALIGMDVLHSTALAIAPTGVGSVWWFVPHDEARS